MLIILAGVPVTSPGETMLEGTSSLSKHALGLAIDINPFYNPYITYNKVPSENADNPCRSSSDLPR